ncbi:NAD(P)-dependent oxidoreductase [Candidatus Pantoea multigeneris]|uniref:NAD(P)-dependent oxidoreductase n=1 Tax=Candidatus Pantoea multigeneris TaxID=2608357 RepID=A0ABX0RH31_9GAMM|nr:NAD(P)-dependent oxidoreductase [Pantoea multigeneris]NIF24637.1 NAD(P)-dependent oxidoreductase [Pantoea multigeneris]
MAEIAIIGFGEAGSVYAADLAAAGVRIWDKKLLSAEGEAMRQRAEALNATPAHSAAEAVQGVKWVLSLVTAGSAAEVAHELAPLLQPGQILLDFNSVAPETKCRSAQIVAGGAGDYLDVAVMAPVPPKRLATPLLIGGAQAERVALRLTELGCNARAASTQVGEVSAIKMCRSVMIKGLEALTTECLRAARLYGVEAPVLNSLHASFPSLGWDDQLPHYLISRVAEHGVRRSEEMQEVVKTLQDVGLSGVMSQATSELQGELPAQLAQRQLRYSDLVPFVWQDVADKLAKAK